MHGHRLRPSIPRRCRPAALRTSGMSGAERSRDHRQEPLRLDHARRWDSEAGELSLREKVIKAHRALLNGSGKLLYFEERGILEQTVKGAFLGYESGAFLYPCRDKSGRVLGLHYKSKARDDKGKRRQW